MLATSVKNQLSLELQKQILLAKAGMALVPLVTTVLLALLTQSPVHLALSLPLRNFRLKEAAPSVQLANTVRLQAKQLLL